MKKNVAGQHVGAQMITAADGTVFAGAVTCYVTGNAGTQAAGSVGSGACAHEGNGFHTYAPAQAETDYDHIAFTFTGTGAIAATVQVYPAFPQTGDTFALANGATGFAAIDTVVDAILVDTAVIGAAGAGLSAVPWNAAWDAEVQSEVQDAIEVNHLDHLLAVDYDPAAKPGTATALLNELVENDAGVSRFTVNALEQAPSGSGASAATIAAAVWDKVQADHVIAGSFGVIATEIADILVDTAEIGAAGAGLTALATAAALATVDNEIAVIDGIVGSILLDTGTDGVVVAAASKSDYRLSATGVDDILDEAYEGTTTLRQHLRLSASALWGKLSGAATTSVAIRDEADTKNRIAATVDADGNRSAVTLDKS